MEISTLLEVKAELKRFEKKLDAAITRLKNDAKDGHNPFGTYETAAVKRAAMDLKNELTRITK
jgi:signal-transduction protein with cAMP-binding, CBS, and nucleotidyltransferase domain